MSLIKFFRNRVKTSAKLHRPGIRHWIGVALLVTSLTAVAQTRVETFVIAVGGESSCTTFIPPAPVGLFFGGIGVYVPQDGLSECNVAGEMRQLVDSAGPLSDSTELDVSFGDRFYSGESNAWAQYGLLGAEAHGFFSGSSDSLLVEGSEAYGMFSERFTFTSDTLPAGASGSIAIRFAMAGDLEAPVNGTSTVILNYRQNTGGIFTLMNAQVDPRFEPRLNPPNDGFTLTQNSISGAGTFQTLFRLPIVFGTPFDFTAAMLAAALPGNGGPFTADFSLGARVSGFDVFDANGDPVTDFVIASGSGTGYDANGVQLP